MGAQDQQQERKGRPRPGLLWAVGLLSGLLIAVIAWQWFLVPGPPEWLPWGVGGKDRPLVAAVAPGEGPQPSRRPRNPIRQRRRPSKPEVPVEVSVPTPPAPAPEMIEEEWVDDPPETEVDEPEPSPIEERVA